MKLKTRVILAISLIVGIATYAVGAPKAGKPNKHSADTVTVTAQEQLEVTTWDPGCEFSMSTNYVVLAPGEQVIIPMDLMGCSEGDMGGLLVFGYEATTNSSRPLTENNNVRFLLVDDITGEEITSDSGSIYTELFDPTHCTLYVLNLDPRQEKKLRIRWELGV